MVKKLVVAFSAIALIMTSVGIASAFMPSALTYGDMIMIPMKVKTTYKRTTGRGGYSSFFMDGCEQYTGGFRPWGTWKATKLLHESPGYPSQVRGSCIHRPGRLGCASGQRMPRWEDPQQQRDLQHQVAGMQSLC